MCSIAAIAAESSLSFIPISCRSGSATWSQGVENVIRDSGFEFFVDEKAVIEDM